MAITIRPDEPDAEMIAGLMRVEEWNEEFRQPNPNGRYPVCKPTVGTHVCERCGWPTNIPMTNRPPCPAVLSEDRWGENWTGELLRKQAREIA